MNNEFRNSPIKKDIDSDNDYDTDFKNGIDGKISFNEAQIEDYMINMVKNDQISSNISYHQKKNTKNKNKSPFFNNSLVEEFQSVPFSKKSHVNYENIRKELNDKREGDIKARFDTINERIKDSNKQGFQIHDIVSISKDLNSTKIIEEKFESIFENLDELASKQANNKKNYLSLSIIGVNEFFSGIFPMDNPSFLKSNSKIIKISCGSNHLIALDNNGTLLALGSNKYGQMGSRLKDNQQTKEFEDQISNEIDTEIEFQQFFTPIFTKKDQDGKGYLVEFSCCNDNTYLITQNKSQKKSSLQSTGKAQLHGIKSKFNQNLFEFTEVILNNKSNNNFLGQNNMFKHVINNGNFVCIVEVSVKIINGNKEPFFNLWVYGKQFDGYNYRQPQLILTQDGSFIKLSLNAQCMMICQELSDKNEKTHRKWYYTGKMFKNEECTHQSKFLNLNKQIKHKVSEDISMYDLEIEDIASKEFSLVILANLYERKIGKDFKVARETMHQRIQVNEIDNEMSVGQDSIFAHGDYLRPLELNLLRDLKVKNIYQVGQQLIVVTEKQVENNHAINGSFKDGGLKDALKFQSKKVIFQTVNGQNQDNIMVFQRKIDVNLVSDLMMRDILDQDFSNDQGIVIST